MFSFDKMITPTIIQILYVVGLIVIALGGLGTLFTMPGASKLLALIVTPIAMVLWRVYMELIMLSFSMYDRMKSIDDKTPPLNG